MLKYSAVQVMSCSLVTNQEMIFDNLATHLPTCLASWRWEMLSTCCQLIGLQRQEMNRDKFAIACLHVATLDFLGAPPIQVLT